MCIFWLKKVLGARQMFPERRDCAPVIELVNGMIKLPDNIPAESNIYDFQYKFSLYVNKNKFFAAAQLLGIASRGICYHHIFHVNCKKKKNFYKIFVVKKFLQYPKDSNNNRLQPSYEHFSISIIAFFHSTNMLMELFGLFLT